MLPLAIIELVTGAGLLLFWAGFFTIGLAPANPPECYLAYEHSFWLPDTILAVALITAAVRLRQGKTTGRSLSLACAGALVFLGVLDFSFNIQNGVYTSSTLDLILNAFINAWCVAAGVYVSVSLA